MIGSSVSINDGDFSVASLYASVCPVAVSASSPAVLTEFPYSSTLFFVESNASPELLTPDIRASNAPSPR